MADDRTRVSTGRDDHFIALPSGFRLDKYELQSVLGQGGFGITYKAWDTALNRSVAIKEYLPSDVAVRLDGTTVSAKSRNDRESFDWGLERFLEEARALARFEEAPSVVRVHDYLQANGTAYMVMALIEGTSLHALYQSEAPLAEARLKAIALPLLEGLQHVHRAGFLHRDIKPSNILIRPNGQPVLIDFGAARQALGGKSRSLTSIFTPGYAPFEQYSSTGRQGPWTDIYALAATLYHGVTGKPPPSAADRIPQDSMVPAATLGAGRYSKSFLAAIDHGMAVFETDRPADAALWTRMLTSETALPRSRPAAAAARPATPLRRMPLVAGIVVAVLMVAGIGVALLPSGVALLSSETGEQRAVRLAEQARLATNEARAAQQAVEAEARRRADEEARLKAEAEARLKAQEEAKRQTADAQRRIEEAARARDDEARARAEAEARRLTQEQVERQRQIDEQVAARVAAEEARRKAEAELAEAQRQAVEAQKQAEALRLQAAAADAEQKKQEEEAARRAADAKAKAEAEAEAKKAEAEAEAKKKAEAESKKKAEAEAEAKRKAEAEAKTKAEAESKKKAEADADAKRKAEAEAKAKAEADAKRKAEEEARAKSQNATSMPPPQASAPSDPAAYVKQHWPTLRRSVEAAISTLAQNVRLAPGDAYDVLEVSEARIVLRVRAGNTSGVPRELSLAFQNRPPSFPFIGEHTRAAVAPAFAHAGAWNFNTSCPGISGGQGIGLVTGQNLRIDGPQVQWHGLAGNDTQLALSGSIAGNVFKLAGTVTNPRGRAFTVDYAGEIANGRFHISGRTGDGTGRTATCEFTGARTGP